MGSGVSLSKGLGILAMSEGREDREAVDLIQARLVKGESLSVAMVPLLPEGVPVHFSVMGSIADPQAFLMKVADYYRKKLMFIKQLLAQLYYPFFLGVSIIGVLCLFVWGVIPRYFEMFTQFSDQTSSLMEWLMDCIEFLKRPSVVGVGVGGLSLGVWWLSARVRQRVLSQLFSYSKGDIVWCLMLLLESGVPMVVSIQALEVPQECVTFGALKQFKEEVLEGVDFVDSFSFGLGLSSFEKGLLTHGIQSGQLVRALTQVLQLIETREQDYYRYGLRIVQPLLLVVLGGVILGIVYLMFIPVLQNLERML